MKCLCDENADTFLTVTANQNPGVDCKFTCSQKHS